jgi:hypothetical protein
MSSDIIFHHQAVPELPLCLGVPKHRASFARGDSPSCQKMWCNIKFEDVLFRSDSRHNDRVDPVKSISSDFFGPKSNGLKPTASTFVASSQLVISIIDPAIVHSMFILLFMFVIRCDIFSSGSKKQKMWRVGWCPVNRFNSTSVLFLL